MNDAAIASGDTVITTAGASSASPSAPRDRTSSRGTTTRSCRAAPWGDCGWSRCGTGSCAPLTAGEACEVECSEVVFGLGDDVNTTFLDLLAQQNRGADNSITGNNFNGNTLDLVFAVA